MPLQDFLGNEGLWWYWGLRMQTKDSHTGPTPKEHLNTD